MMKSEGITKNKTERTEESEDGGTIIEISGKLPLNHDKSPLENENNTNYKEVELKKNKPTCLSKKFQDALFEVKKSVSQNNEDEYPDDLNPFNDANEEPVQAIQKPNLNLSSNPFEDEEDTTPANPKPTTRNNITTTPLDEDVSSHLNPFEEDEESEEKNKKPHVTKRKVVEPSRIKCGPFCSDDEGIKENGAPEPKPRFTKTALELKSHGCELSVASSSSLIYLQSAHSLENEKPKPVPKLRSMFSIMESGPSLLTSSPCHSVIQSPKATTKRRKKKKAPLPPISRPLDGSPILKDRDITFADDLEKEIVSTDEQTSQSVQSK